MSVRSYWPLLCVCWPLAATAAFDETDVIQIEASATLFHDNNLYRLPDVDPRFFGIDPDKKSDTARVLGIGLKLDKPVSRQRFIADLKLSDTKYDRNTDLDHTGHNARLAWQWRVGNLWDGDLEYGNRKYLAGFGDSRLTFKDMIEAQNLLASARYQFHPRWRVGGELTARESEHSAPTRQIANIESTGAAASVTYSTPAGNSIGAEIRHRQAEYPNRDVVIARAIDDSYTEREANALLHWQLSGKLVLDATLGYTQRRYDTVSERDYSAPTGRISAAWEPTGKLRFILTGDRDIRGLQDAEDDFVLLKSVTASAIWAITTKVALQGDLKYEKRDYLGEPIVSLSGLPSRKDTVKMGKIGLTYSPFRYLDLSISYERGDRNSNFDLNDYDYRSWFGTLRVRF